MKRKRFSVEQIVAVLKQAEMGASVADLLRHLGIAEQTFYHWKQRYAGLESEQVREFKQLQDENTKLKRLVAELSLDKVMLQDVLSTTFCGLRGNGLWWDMYARPTRSVSGAPAGPSAVRGPPISIRVLAIPAPHSGSGSGRWPRRECGTATGRFGCCSIGKGGPWARSSCIVSTGKKA